VVESEVLGKELDLKARGLQLGPGTAAQQGRAYLDGIKLLVTPEDSVRIGALLAGQGTSSARCRPMTKSR
jgi:peptide/nickel transport system substrate-binding protein